MEREGFHPQEIAADNGLTSLNLGAYGSGTFLSFEAFWQPKRKISESDFSWVEPLKPTIWNLFEICPKNAGQSLSDFAIFAGYGPFI